MSCSSFGNALLSCPVHLQFKIETLLLPFRYRLPHNGTISVCIRIGAIKLFSKEVRQQPSNGYNKYQHSAIIKFDQLLECDIEKRTNVASVTLRINTLMHGRNVHKSLAVERMELSCSLESSPDNGYNVVFSGLNGVSLQLQVFVQSNDHFSEDSHDFSNKLVSGTASRDRPLNLVVSMYNVPATGTRVVEDASSLSANSLQPQAKPRKTDPTNAPSASMTSPARSPPPLFTQPTSCTTHESKNSDCPHCAGAAATTASAQRDLRRCQSQLRALTQKRAQEKEDRKTNRAEVAEHVSKMFVQNEQLKAESAYLLKTLIHTKMELADTQQQLDALRSRPREAVRTGRGVRK